MSTFLPLALILIVATFVLREDTVLLVLYLVAGVYLAGFAWTRYTARHVRVSRVYTSRAFFDQPVEVRLKFENTGWLPVVWLKAQESLPIELVVSQTNQYVLTLAPKGQAQISYRLLARKRGQYQLGPLQLDSGDLLGLARQTSQRLEEGVLIVYPRIYPLAQIGLPSQSPLGAIREHRPVLEDPARVRGKRDYTPGDSLRRIDWKASASTGRLQVKQYEPSIALNVCVALNLDPADYEPKRYPVTAETAIVTAASIAAWANRQQQPVGLSTNGINPLADEDAPPVSVLPARRGSAALMPILDHLARVQLGARASCADLLRQASMELAWGATLVLITSQINTDILDHLFAAQRRGLNVMLITVGPQSGHMLLQGQAGHFGIPVQHIEVESDLEVWGEIL